MGNKNKKRTTRSGLPARMELFISLYLAEPNATKAAIGAGYAPKSAHVMGCQLLKNPKVAAELQRLRDARASKTGITAERVLKELELLAFSDCSDYDVSHDGHVSVKEGKPREIMRAVSGIKYRVTVRPNGDAFHETELRFWDKPSTLKLAGRHVGLFADKVDDPDVVLMAEKMLKRMVESAKRELDNNDGGGAT